MRKSMAPKKKQKRNKKVVNKRVAINKKLTNSTQKKPNDFFLIFTKLVSSILAKPFFLINLAINKALILVKNIFLQLFNLVKQILKLLLEAPTIPPQIPSSACTGPPITGHST